MAPLFLFLASSFNVELVYIILKSITQFSYINGTDEKSQGKIKKLKLKRSDGDVTLHLSEIKIKDIDKWS